MNDLQNSAIEPVESERPESADSDLSDEALDRPLGGGKYSLVCAGNHCHGIAK